MDADRVALHQVHPAKLGADITASVVSNFLLWRHDLRSGLAVRVALPMLGSALVLGFANLEPLRDKPQGAYVLANMPPSAMAVRLAGDVVMAAGSWRRSPRMILVGIIVIVAGWSHGLVASGPAEPSSL